MNGEIFYYYVDGRKCAFALTGKNILLWELYCIDHCIDHASEQDFINFFNSLKHESNAATIKL